MASLPGGRRFGAGRFRRHALGVGAASGDREGGAAEPERIERLDQPALGPRPAGEVQVGSMGGMAISMALRLDESGGLLPHVKVLMLLDRAPDIYLAQRSGAEGWLIKPLDALRLKRAALAIMNGEFFQEGVPHPVPVEVQGPTEPTELVTPEEEPTPAG